jgi:hypothetical protein
MMEFSVYYGSQVNSTRFVHEDGNPFILQNFTIRGMKLKVFISDQVVGTLGLGNTAAEGIPVAYLEQCQQKAMYG